MKILRNYIVTGALYSGDTGPEAAVGDQVKMFLDVEAHPGFPEFILGVIQHPIVKVNCDSATSYSIEYDEDDLLEEVNFLLLDDVVDVTVVSQVDVLADALDIVIGVGDIIPSMIVDNVPNVLTTSLSSGFIISIKELHVGKIQSGGLFILDKSSTAEVNSGTVLATDTGVGRWHRQFIGPLDIRWFGATSDVAVNQAPYIQAALDVGLTTDDVWDYAPNSVYIPRGNWFISEPLKIYRGTVLEGCGDWDNGGSLISMMNESNCPAIQTPTAHSGRTATQYLRLHGFRIDGRVANQSEEATAIEWDGTFVGSTIDYVMVSNWLGPAIVCSGSSDTHLSRIWAIAIKTDSFAIQAKDAATDSGNNGYMLMTDIYCEQVQRLNGAKGDGLLLNHLVSIDIHGLHTENLGRPVTVDSCHRIRISAFTSHLDGYGTHSDTLVENTVDELASSSLIYYRGGSQVISIGSVTAAFKETGTPIWRTSLDVPSYVAATLPDHTTVEDASSWSGLEWTDLSISQGLGMDVTGASHLGNIVVAGNFPGAHPEIILREEAHGTGGDNFRWQMRVDFGEIRLHSNVAGREIHHMTVSNSSSNPIYNSISFLHPLVLSYDAAVDGEPAYTEELFRSGNNLQYKSSSGKKGIPQFITAGSAPIDGTTAGLLGEEIIVSETDVYKCVRVTPSKWVKLSP